MMNKVSRLLPAAVTLVMAITPAIADDVHRSIDAHPDGTVSISNTAGSITVAGWSRNQVDVTADLGHAVDELIVERDGEEVLVKVKVPRNNARGISSDLIVRVPEQSSIDVAGVSADIEVSGVLGEQRLHAVSGDIVAEAFEADVEIEAVSGDIEVAGDDQAMFTKLTSVSGDIDTAALAGDIEVSSVSGDVMVASSRFQRARANTVNGDLTFRAAIENGGRLDLETINGDIDLDFAGEISGRFDIETFNGDIDSCFGPEPQRTSKYTPGRELKFTEGSGETRIVIRTLNGSLRMCRD